MSKRDVQYFLAANDLVYIVTVAGSSPALPAIVSTLKLT
jgi:hypothetical protein